MAISDNVMCISEVPSEARDLDEALAKSDMHLLGDPLGQAPKGRSVLLGGPFSKSILVYILSSYIHLST